YATDRQTAQATDHGGPDRERAGGDRAVGRSGVLSVDIPVAQVVEDVNTRRGSAEHGCYGQSGELGILVEEGAGEDQPGQASRVLDPLPWAQHADKRARDPRRSACTVHCRWRRPVKLERWRRGPVQLV